MPFFSTILYILFVDINQTSSKKNIIFNTKQCKCISFSSARSSVRINIYYSPSLNFIDQSEKFLDMDLACLM